MKKTLLILFLAAATIGPTFGQAPDSIGGYIYHANERGFGIGIAELLSVSILFSSDGTYTEIMVRDGSGPVAVQGSFFVQYTQPLSGTYTYQKTGANTGSLILLNGEVSGRTPVPDSIALTFLTSALGTVDENGTEEAYSGTFSISTSSAPGTVPLCNVSSLTIANQGSPAVVGFVLNGTQDVLIRIVGPGLASFGITNFLLTPSIMLYGPNGIQFVFNYGVSDGAGWSATAAGISTQQQAWQMVGAFPLTLGSADISEVVILPAGPYSIVAQPATGGGGGSVLIEVYILP